MQQESIEISNASDALDKLYYRSLTDKDVKVDKEDLEICLEFDKDEGRIINAELANPGATIVGAGYCVDDRYVEISPAGYGINVTLKFF